jgi:hypothetical protein
MAVIQKHTNPSTIAVIRALALVAFLALLAGCGERAEEKSLTVRLYEHRLKRCEKMMPKGETHRCEPAEGATYKTGLSTLHRVMVEQVKTTFPATGLCTHHVVFLVCHEKLMDGTPRDVLYRLESATDGSDSMVMIVWSDDSGG